VAPVGTLDLALCPFISACIINTENLMLVIYEINLLSLYLCFTECYFSLMSYSIQVPTFGSAGQCGVFCRSFESLQ
jgi:hypothetical protein